jgi:diadenosine tetraphosphatase ApaH/serine/threonine PP2A family protein phosphatase
VLAALDDDAPDAVWCLGDVVGYGPRPNECCARVAERADLCLVGNHDLVVLGRLDVAEFSHDAADSARWTASVLSAGSRRFLEPLGADATREGVDLYHASARDPIWEYVLTAEAALVTLALTEAPLVLVGHSHVAMALSFAEGRLEGGVATGGTELELGTADRWLLNPGSVGQPRDGDPRAAYLLLDLEERRASYRRLSYPIERTQEEIRERGLPEALAARLEHGI